MDDELGTSMGKDLGHGLGEDLDRTLHTTTGGDVTKEIAVQPGPGPGPIGFRVLGPFQMTVGGQPWELGPEQEQRLLVALLDARGARVPHGRLMEAIWDDQPEGALDALYHLAHALRRRFKAAGQERVLSAVNGTYMLAISADCVDVHRFHALVEQARQSAGHDDGRAVGLLEQALRLHRGEPLAGMRGRWVDNYRHGLVEERRAIELALYEAAIRRGESRDRLPGLQALFRERPQDEWVAWLLMHALYRAGRQSEALAVRQEVDEHLDTIAVASLKALRELYDRILRQDDDLLQPEALSFPVGLAGVRARALGRPGSHAPHPDQDQLEKSAMNEPQGDVIEDARSREGTAVLDQEPHGQPGADGQPSGYQDADPQRQAGADSRPQTSIVFNGPVDARRGVIGTKNVYAGHDE